MIYNNNKSELCDAVSAKINVKSRCLSTCNYTVRYTVNRDTVAGYYTVGSEIPHSPDQVSGCLLVLPGKAARCRSSEIPEEESMWGKTQGLGNAGGNWVC